MEAQRDALVGRLFEAVLGFNDLHMVEILPIENDFWRFYRLQ